MSIKDAIKSIQFLDSKADDEDDEYVSLDITNASALAKQTGGNNDDGSKKSIFLAHKNLSRMKCLLAEDISEIRQNILELATRSDSLSDEEACGEGAPAESESSDDIVALYEFQEDAGNPCRNGSNNDVTSDTEHRSVKDAVPLSCKVSLKDNEPVMYHRVTNMLLKMSGDNNVDEGDNDEDDDNDEGDGIRNDANLLPDGLAASSSLAFKESSSSQNALPMRYSDATNDARVSSSAPDNNKNRNSHEDAVDGNEAAVLPEYVCKETSSSRDAARTSLHYNDTASTSKPFKLPILEKMHKTANVQSVEIEENAVALLETSFPRQDQLEEVRCLDLEPRSSNSSEESNSDMESQHASVSHNDVKKVSDMRLARTFFPYTENLYNKSYYRIL